MDYRGLQKANAEWLLRLFWRDNVETKSFDLSIIVPIGNFPKDKENLRKICNRLSHINVEVIFILDSQSSNCTVELEGICRSNFLFDHKVLAANLGNPGAARNLGLDFYSRSWVTFWDSDDLPNPIPYLSHTKSVGTSPTIIVGAYVENKLKISKYSKHLFGENEKHNLEIFSFNPGIWRIIFTKDVVGFSRFSSNSMGEDQEFICKILSKNPKIHFSSEIFYEHCTGSSSSLTGSRLHMPDLSRSIESCYGILLQAGLFRREILFICLRQIQTCFKYGENSAKIFAVRTLIKCIMNLRRLEILDIFRFIYLQVNKV